MPQTEIIQRIEDTKEDYKNYSNHL